MKRRAQNEKEIIKKQNLVIPFKDAYWVQTNVTATDHKNVIQKGFVSHIEMSIGREGVVYGSYVFIYENKEGAILEERIIFNDDPEHPQVPMIFDNLKSATMALREQIKKERKNVINRGTILKLKKMSLAQYKKGRRIKNERIEN